MKRNISIFVLIFVLSACSTSTLPESSYIPLSKPGVIEPGIAIEGNQVQPEEDSAALPRLTCITITSKEWCLP